MSGYQVQNPSFFVALNPATSLESTVAFLQAGFNQPAPYVFNTGATALSLDAYTGLIGGYVEISGGTACTLTLPSRADVGAAIEQLKKTTLNVNGVKASSSTNASLPIPILNPFNQVTKAFNWKVIVFNNNSGAITLAPGTDVDINNTGNTIAAGDIAILNCVIYDRISGAIAINGYGVIVQDS